MYKNFGSGLEAGQVSNVCLRDDDLIPFESVSIAGVAQSGPLLGEKEDTY